MIRDLRRLADTRFDLVVVGAGFYGALAAWDATLRGLSVALIDRGDFGGATSFNNLKTLHGGLRSLQSFDLPQMRLFIRERRTLARVAPHLVRPLPFVVPTDAHPLRSRLAMKVALAINDAVARDRHAGLDDPALHLPGGEILSRDECLRRNPLIDPRGVTGGAVWHDYQMRNTDRMTFAFVDSAAQAGAVVANYATATRLLHDGPRVAGVAIEDGLSGERFDLRARTVLNATGPWASSFLAAAGGSLSTPAAQLSRAMNLVIRAQPVAQGCGGRARGRFLFLVPWRDVSMVGTSHDPHADGPDALVVTRAHVDAFLAEVQEAFPLAGIVRDDITLVHRGLLPMVSSSAGHVKLLRESRVVNHARDQAPGLISMFGVRYTTARQTAEDAVDAVFADRGAQQPPPCRTARTPVAGGQIDDVERFFRETRQRQTVTGLLPETLRRLAITYGRQLDAVLDLMRDPILTKPLGAGTPVTAAEIVHAARHESAVRLADALIRRTEAGSAGHPGTEVVAHAARLMARECGWSDERVAREVSQVDDFYVVPPA